MSGANAARNAQEARQLAEPDIALSYYRRRRSRRLFGLQRDARHKNAALLGRRLYVGRRRTLRRRLQVCVAGIAMLGTQRAAVVNGRLIFRRQDSGPSR